MDPNPVGSCFEKRFLIQPDLDLEKKKSYPNLWIWWITDCNVKCLVSTWLLNLFFKIVIRLVDCKNN